MLSILDDIIARLICSFIFGGIWTIITNVVLYIIKEDDISNNYINIMLVSNTILIFLCLAIFGHGN